MKIDKCNKDVKPEMMKVISDNIPDKLKQHDQWICWEWTLKNKKWTKPPRSITGMPRGIHDDLFTFDEVIKAHLKNPILGIGFVLKEDDPFCGVDIDNCIKSNGKLNKKARKIIKACGSYTEISPSGRGIRIIGKGQLEKSFNKDGLEVYDRGRYLTITGNIFAKRGH